MIHSQLQNWSQNKNTWVVHIFLYFAFCFTGFVLFFPCLKLSTTLSPSVCSFVSCRNWSGSCSCPGAGSEWKHGPCCTSAEILLPRFAGGLMNPWRRRWCVLKNEAFMWFRTKQEALKSGWLYKKGGGMSTLSRRNWKRRWFVLRESKLMYFENDSEEKLKGTIDIRRAKWVQK